VRSLALQDTNLFAGTDSGGVFLSPSNGAYWIPVSDGLTNISVNSVTAIGRDLYAATDSGLFCSTNAGIGWSLLGLAGKFINAVAAIDTVLFAGTDAEGLFRSTDKGANWSMVSDPGMPPWVRALAVIPPFVIAGTNGGVYRTPNNGGYWIPASTGMWNANVHALCVTGTDLYAGTYGGVFRSTDFGTQWTVASSGLKTTVIEALAARAGTLYAAGRNGLFRSTDRGNSWSHLSSGWAPSIAIDGMKLYTGAWDHVFYSFDDCGTWDFLPLGGAGGRVFALAVNGAELLAGSETDGVLRVAISVPGAGTVTTTDLKDTTVYSLAVSGTDLFAGTEGGVFRSTNGGKNWVAVNQGLTKLDVLALAVKGADLFAGTGGGGVYLSTNRGDSWTSVASGLGDVAVQSFAVSGTNIFSGTWQGGVFHSSNNGASWVAVNDGLMSSSQEPSSVVHGLAIAGTELFAGTRGSGVWRRPLSEMVASAGAATGEPPVTYALQQNYPNPFNPTTVISYQLPAVSDVRLVVYDLLGQEVSTLVNERKAPGRYGVKFDATGLSSGVYFYRLQAGDFVQTRKFLLLR
jgi:ligand-binding sensor domain-containing protein